MTITTEPTGIFGRLQAYPTIHPTSEPTTLSAPDLAELPGFAALIRLSNAQGEQVVLSLWRSREDAELVDERLAGTMPRADQDQIYELDAMVLGLADGPPTVALLARFDGPMGNAQLAAARRRGAEQVGPRLAQVPGLLRVIILWHPLDRSMVVMYLAGSPTAMHDASLVVTSTWLGPDDDPKLLNGPDRVGLHQVDHYTWSLTPAEHDHA